MTILNKKHWCFLMHFDVSLMYFGVLLMHSDMLLIASGDI